MGKLNAKEKYERYSREIERPYCKMRERLHDLPSQLAGAKARLLDAIVSDNEAAIQSAEADIARFEREIIRLRARLVLVLTPTPDQEAELHRLRMEMELEQQAEFEARVDAYNTAREDAQALREQLFTKITEVYGLYRALGKMGSAIKPQPEDFSLSVLDIQKRCGPRPFFLG